MDDCDAQARPNQRRDHKRRRRLFCSNSEEVTPEIKMRFAALTLLVLFSFQILDVPIPKNLSNPKTCCGRSVCLCTHLKGAMCPFKNKMIHFAEEHSHDVATSTAQAHKISPLFTPTPCHTDSPKTVLSGYVKDFELTSVEELFLNLKTESLFQSTVQTPAFLYFQTIERPPKFISSAL